MVNKNYFALIAFIAFFVSCTGNTEKSQEVPSLSITKDSVFVSNTSDVQHKLTVSILNDNILSEDIGKNKSLSLLDLAKKCSDKRELALTAVKNANTIPVNIKIDELIDTLVYYTIEPYNEEETSFSISGQCAPLVSKLSSASRSVDLKKWLFRKQAHLEDDQVKVFTGLVNQLARSKTTEYVTNSAMPVLHNFAGVKYNVKTNMEGEYFVLFAAKSSKEIDKFVEEVVANDFELCSKSPSGAMSCYRDVNSNGYMCISLIAIKKDWSYKIQPLGLVAIDNVVISQGNDANISSFNFPNNVKVLLPEEKPEIFGTCNVRSASGGGNGIECNVTFHIIQSGDIKSITVKRTKKLCYDSWTHKVENRVVYTKDIGSMHSFTMMLHLVDGDNYIPVVIEDNHGNKTEFELNERASFTRSNAPSINIDNNVNIYD